MKNEMIEETLKKVYWKLPGKDSIEFTISDEKPRIYNSKVGGIPYFPKNMPYPTDLTEMKYPLVFIAQINFEEIPCLEGFPRKGMIQFFWNGSYDLNYTTFDYSNPRFTVQDNYRVIYHPEIEYNPDKVMGKEEFSPIFKEKWYNTNVAMIPHTRISEPLEQVREAYFMKNMLRALKPYCLKYYNSEKIYPTYSDYRFEPLFLKYYYEAVEMPLDTVDDIRSSVAEKSEEINKYTDAYIGGYPYFVTEDPRNVKKFRKYDTMLFELLSVDTENKYLEIGAYGTMSFLIPGYKLARCDFSDVLFFHESL